MYQTPQCPNCNTELRGVRRWFGLLRRYPSQCHACGARLGYDTVGGVYVLEKRDEEMVDDSASGD